MEKLGKKKRWYQNKKTILLLLTLTVLILAAGTVYRVRAIFDPKTAVHVNPDEIEDATLIIGTHLIHISALTDELYEIAEQSASDSAQNRRYYKSELAGGAWFDITDASTLAEITSAGKMVNKSVIAALDLTHHTKSDKITYDLRTNQAANMFDISDPYNLSGLKELEPYKNQYDILTEMVDSLDEASSSDSFDLYVTRTFFGMDMHNGKTDSCDAQLAALQSYYDVLASADGMEAEMAAVTKVMKAVDASRRAEVMRILLEDSDKKMDRYVEVLYGSEIWEETPDEGYSPNTDLCSGLSESIGNVSESYLNYQADMLSEGTTVMSRKEYSLAMDLITNAESGTFAACDTAVEKLIYLDNISQSVIDKKDNELGFLQDDLYPEGKRIYLEAIAAGENGEYKAAASNSSISKATLANLIKEQKNEANAFRLEMQFFIQAMTDRMENTAESSPAQDYIKELLTESEGLAATVTDDAFAASARTTITEYQTWLGELLNSLIAGAGGSDADLLQKQKDTYQEKKMDALDQNDLAGAAKFDALLLEVDKKLEEAGGGAAKAIADMKDQALKDAMEGDTASAEQGIEALKDLADSNPNAAGEALSELGEKLADVEGAGDLAEQAASAGGSVGNVLTADDITSLLGNMDAMSEKDQASALIATHMYAEHTGHSTIIKLAGTMADKLFNQGNRYLYMQYKEPSQEFLSTQTIGRCMGYRYVFNNSQKKVTLSKRGSFYEFQAFQKTVAHGVEKLEMGTAAGFQSTVYIEESYAQKLFNCQAVYIIQCDYAVLATPDMMDKAGEWFAAMLEKGGE